MPVSKWMPAFFVFVLHMLLVPAATTAQPVTYEKTRVAVETATGNSYTFHVELAETPEQRSRGLMFRDSIPENGGMLFLFDVPHVASFWMRNTFISLDMIFIQQDGRIVNIHERTVPGSQALHSAAAPVTAVLEIRGGLASRLGIRPGDKVIHPAFEVPPLSD